MRVACIAQNTGNTGENITADLTAKYTSQSSCDDDNDDDDKLTGVGFGAVLTGGSKYGSATSRSY